MAHAVIWDYAPARMDLIRQWEQRGVKQGDAVITAHLEVATICYLVSENRDC
jgi:5'-deoxynucleotidase YfbR-like HD superfamily hydrolase